MGIKLLELKIFAVSYLFLHLAKNLWYCNIRYFSIVYRRYNNIIYLISHYTSHQTPNEASMERMLTLNKVIMRHRAVIHVFQQYTIEMLILQEQLGRCRVKVLFDAMTFFDSDWFMYEQAPHTQLFDSAGKT